MSAENTVVSQEQQTTAPAPEQAESAEQLDLLAPEGEQDDESRASETQQEETDEQKAARLVKEKDIRDKRERNKSAAERRLVEKERDTYRTLVERFLEKQESTPQAVSPSTTTDAGREPTRDFNPETGKPFETYDEFIEMRAAWKAEKRAIQAFEGRMQSAVRAIQEYQSRANATQVSRAHAQRMSEFAKENPDFEATASRADIEIPRVAGAIIERMSNGPALILAMAEKPEIAASLRNMDNEVEMATYLGQLSQWMNTSRSSQISNAAPAGKTVGTKPAVSSTPPDDPDEYERWANAKFGKR